MSRQKLSNLSDRNLVSSLKQLVSTERAHVVEVLQHLIEVERRKLHLEMGFASMFEYCVSGLRYSHSAAGRRIASARVLRRFPEIGAMLASGELNLVTVSMIAKLLTRANKDSLLSRIRGRSQREVEGVVAEYRPESMIRDRVRSVCVRLPAASKAAGTAVDSGASNAESADDADAAPTGGSAPSAHEADKSGGDPIPLPDPPRVIVARKHEIKFVVGEEFMQRLEEVKALLSNRYPNATLEQLFDATMEAFIDRNCPARRDRRRKKKASLPPVGVRRTRANKNGAGGKANERSAGYSCGAPSHEQNRYIPAAVRDRVFARGRGRCTYVSPSGRRCSATRHLEVDHVEPYGRGGTNEASNLRLLCRAHNLVAAEHSYGRDVIAGRVRRE